VYYSLKTPLHVTLDNTKGKKIPETIFFSGDQRIGFEDSQAPGCHNTLLPNAMPEIHPKRGCLCMLSNAVQTHVAPIFHAADAFQCRGPHPIEYSIRKEETS
jgi:hypothetical protein